MDKRCEKQKGHNAKKNRATIKVKLGQTQREHYVRLTILKNKPSKGNDRWFLYQCPNNGPYYRYTDSDTLRRQYVDSNFKTEAENESRKVLRAKFNVNGAVEDEVAASVLEAKKKDTKKKATKKKPTTTKTATTKKSKTTKKSAAEVSVNGLKLDVTMRVTALKKLDRDQLLVLKKEVAAEIAQVQEALKKNPPKEKKLGFFDHLAIIKADKRFPRWVINLRAHDGTIKKAKIADAIARLSWYHTGFSDDGVLEPWPDNKSAYPGNGIRNPESQVVKTKKPNAVLIDNHPDILATYSEVFDFEVD
jgi:hypothetical protein